jgi:hypothetical protein
LQFNPDTDADGVSGENEVKVAAGVDTDDEEVETPEL